VDISTEFTNLIVTQRGFEANARMITTLDTVTNDTVNLQATPGN
jgi:flagellar hook protein FlgE